MSTLYSVVNVYPALMSGTVLDLIQNADCERFQEVNKKIS